MRVSDFIQSLSPVDLTLLLIVNTVGTIVLGVVLIVVIRALRR